MGDPAHQHRMLTDDEKMELMSKHDKLKQLLRVYGCPLIKVPQDGYCLFNAFTEAKLQRTSGAKSWKDLDRKERFDVMQDIRQETLKYIFPENEYDLPKSSQGDHAIAEYRRNFSTKIKFNHLAEWYPNYKTKFLEKMKTLPSNAKMERIKQIMENHTWPLSKQKMADQENQTIEDAMKWLKVVYRDAWQGNLYTSRYPVYGEEIHIKALSQIYGFDIHVDSMYSNVAGCLVLNHEFLASTVTEFDLYGQNSIVLICNGDHFDLLNSFGIQKIEESNSEPLDDGDGDKPENSNGVSPDQMPPDNGKGSDPNGIISVVPSRRDELKHENDNRKHNNQHPPPKNPKKPPKKQNGNQNSPKKMEESKWKKEEAKIELRIRLMKDFKDACQKLNNDERNKHFKVLQNLEKKQWHAQRRFNDKWWDDSLNFIAENDEELFTWIQMKDNTEERENYIWDMFINIADEFFKNDVTIGRDKYGQDNKVKITPYIGEWTDKSGNVKYFPIPKQKEPVAGQPWTFFKATQYQNDNNFIREFYTIMHHQVLYFHEYMAQAIHYYIKNIIPVEVQNASITHKEKKKIKLQTSLEAIKERREMFKKMGLFLFRLYDYEGSGKAFDLAMQAIQAAVANGNSNVVNNYLPDEFQSDPERMTAWLALVNRAIKRQMDGEEPQQAVLIYRSNLFSSTYTRYLVDPSIPPSVISSTRAGSRRWLVV